MGPPLAPSPIPLLEDFFRKECDVELLGICKGEPSVSFSSLELASCSRVSVIDLTPPTTEKTPGKGIANPRPNPEPHGKLKTGTKGLEA